jgi:hypothetical protein
LSQFLSQFNFKIVYHPGTAGGKLDALTRQSRDLPKEGDDWALENQTTIIKPENILLISAATSSNQPDTTSPPNTSDAPTLSTLFCKAYTTDPFPNKVIQMLKDGMKQCKDITLAECEKHDNLLLYQSQIWVPEQLDTLADQRHWNTLQEPIPGLRCIQMLTTTPGTIIPVNIQSPINMHHLVY